MIHTLDQAAKDANPRTKLQGRSGRDEPISTTDLDASKSGRSVPCYGDSDDT